MDLIKAIKQDICKKDSVNETQSHYQARNTCYIHLKTSAGTKYFCLITLLGGFFLAHAI
jgi:hypothetical protein